MNDLIDEFSPYKIEYISNIVIIYSTLGNYVIKKCNKDLVKLFSYLKSRSFYNIPNIYKIDNDYIIYEYLDDIVLSNEERLIDIVNLLSKLHNKTCYFKEVSNNLYKNIYDDILNRINYYIDYYNKLFDDIFNDIYPSPSKYMFLCNFTNIIDCYYLCNKYLDKWFKLVSESNKQRVSIIHGNLSCKHYINKDNGYFISWDNYSIDTPVLDFYYLYHNEYMSTDFIEILKKYLSGFNLLEQEKIFLGVLLLLPLDIKFNDNEYNNCMMINSCLEYIERTKKLVINNLFEDKEE